MAVGSVPAPPHIQWQCEVKRKMDEYYRLAQCLPQPYAAELAALPMPTAVKAARKFAEAVLKA